MRNSINTLDVQIDDLDAIGLAVSWIRVERDDQGTVLESSGEHVCEYVITKIGRTEAGMPLVFRSQECIYERYPILHGRPRKVSTGGIFNKLGESFTVQGVERALKGQDVG